MVSYFLQTKAMLNDFRELKNLFSLICGFRIPDSGFWFPVPIPDSGFRFPGCPFIVIATARLLILSGVSLIQNAEKSIVRVSQGWEEDRRGTLTYCT